VLARILVTAVLAGGCRGEARDKADEKSPSTEPTSVAVPRPRGPNEIDGLGVGRLWLGTPASELAALGFVGAGQRGSAAFSQNGTPVAATVRFGETFRFERDGALLIEVKVEPARVRVDEIAIYEPGPKTREGIGVGATLAELRAAYGEPEVTRERIGNGTCHQFALAWGVDFCILSGDTVSTIVIPALRPSPLVLGEDLAKLGAAIDGHRFGGRVYHVPRLIAPCLLAIGESVQAIIVRGDAVYVTSGGWRRRDRSIVLCSGSNVYELDAAGVGIRWRRDGGELWKHEPAECTTDATRVTCRGVTEQTLGFEGDFIGDLVVQHEVTTKLESVRALARDGKPIGDCGRLIERAWRELAPALAFLELPTDDAAHLAYLDSPDARTFAGDCATARDEDRECMLAMRELVRPHQNCAMSAPGFDWRGRVPKEPEPPLLAPAEARKRERALVGTWRRTRDHFADQIWTFRSNGELVVDGEAQGKYTVERAGEIAVRSPRMETSHTFARADKARIYAADRRIHCPVDRTRANLRLESQDTLMIRDTTCKTLSPHGALADAKCTSRGDTLEVVYTPWMGAQKSLAFAIVDDCYVDPEVEPFVRVK